MVNEWTWLSCAFLCRCVVVVASTDYTPQLSSPPPRRSHTCRVAVAVFSPNAPCACSRAIRLHSASPPPPLSHDGPFVSCALSSRARCCCCCCCCCRCCYCCYCCLIQYSYCARQSNILLWLLIRRDPRIRLHIHRRWKGAAIARPWPLSSRRPPRRLHRRCGSGPSTPRPTSF